MAENVKSGKAILDDFFNGIDKIENVDLDITKMLERLYREDKLTDINVKNELQKLRDGD